MAFAMVGEALVSASVETLLNRITSNEFRDFFANRKLNVPLLDELKIKLLALNAVLNDAEEKQITVPAVKEWLDELKDAVLDAEDLLDEINTESLRCKCKVMEEGDSQNFTTQVRSFLSSPFNQFHRSMNSKLEEISARLQHFVNQIAILNLQSVTRRVSFGRKTDSLVEPVVVARRDDKEKLLSMLLSNDDRKSNNIGVITILGMGGLGKTTLAQVLYNDTQVVKHFDLKAWAWVSDDFDVFRITKNLLESITGKPCDITNLDNLRVELRNNLKDKKFLLVLDDLWNDMYNDWHNLITPLSCGKEGSRIVVTTRQPRVAQITHTFPVCELETLTEENCWCILAKHAFGHDGYDKYPILEEIGRKIARKCGGLPLAAKTLGGLLRSNVDPEEWNRVLNNNLWAHGDVLPALRISYLHLPAHLKRCFAYCSIFPKQHLLNRKEMTLLWMAEGFLQQSYGERTMELAGEDCFNELLSRSLIQKDETVVGNKFRMHDLIYDLARLVSGKSSCYFEGLEIPKNVRHLTFLSKYFDVSKKFEGFYELKCLRTFLPQNPYESLHYISKEVSHDLLPKLSCLRALSLSCYKNISEIPDSISNLIHLRYLNLSYTSITSLSDAIFKLYNLQTLILSNCKLLTHLPGKIGNLVNLRHLDVSNTNLVEMPAQICRLQELRTLTVFVIGRQGHGLSVGELSNFPYLQGKLSIQQLQNIVDPMDAVQANLKNKGQIEELTLQWGSDPEDSQIEKDVLENLQPSRSLKKLCIEYYGGTSYPNWVGDSSFSNIVMLRISDCSYCLSLPPFGQLPSLKELIIGKMGMVKTIGHEFYCRNGSFSPIFQPFPSLETLEFEDMLEWQEWLPYEDLSDNGDNFAFPCLQRLRLFNCPKLQGNLPNYLPSLREVDIKECNLLEAKVTDLQWNSSIEELSVKKCDNLLQYFPRMMLGANCLQRLTLDHISSFISFPDDGLPASLRSLRINDCEKLEFLSLETLMHKYTSLETLEIFKSCHSMSSFPLGCFPSLQHLTIIGCPNLEAISTQPGGAAPNLCRFWIHDCKKLKSLPEQIDLPALEDLVLVKVGELASLPSIFLSSNIQGLMVDVAVLSLMFKLESSFPFQRLTSLLSLSLAGLAGDENLVNTLLKKQLLPTSLEWLRLFNFGGLRLLEGLQHLTSLKTLYIHGCPKLESLPEDQLPSSLERLDIMGCPLLESRYQSQKGKYWSKIAQIPAIEINKQVILK